MVEANTGEKAIACAESIADMLFTDIRLGGTLTGWDVAEQCRAPNPSMPVIYATGHSHVRPRPVPGSIWLQKPYAPDQLVETIRHLASNGGLGDVP